MKEKVEDLFYVVSIFVVIFGGIAWITNLSFQVQASSNDLKQIKTRIEQNAAEFEEIRTRLVHIEDSLINHKRR